VITLKADRAMPNMGGWQDRHDAAINAPNREERAYLGMIRAWKEYADSYRHQWDSGVGDDGFLGPYWQEIGASLVGMLSGPLGTRLDLATLDKYIRYIAKENGIDAEEL